MLRRQGATRSERRRADPRAAMSANHSPRPIGGDTTRKAAGKPEQIPRGCEFCWWSCCSKTKDFGRNNSAPEVKERCYDKWGILPAVAAVTTVAAITAAPATTATSAAIAPTASATTTAAITSAPTATTRPLGLRTRFVDYQVPATEILTVEIGDRAIRFFIIGNFDEGKTPRLAREPIPNQIDCGRVDPYLSEPLLQLFFRCREREITDVKLLHLGTPSARNLTTIAERTDRPVPPGGQTGGRAVRAGVFQWSRRYSRKSLPFATRKGLERGGAKSRLGIAPTVKSGRMREQTGGETE